MIWSIITGCFTTMLDERGEQKTEDAMKLGTYANVEVHRVDKMLVVQFLKPHQVISTCRVHGGLHDGLECVFNHQSCEPAAHSRKELKTIISNPEEYLSGLCSRYALPLNSASLGTAANMNYAAIETERFRGLEVTAICTGGVEGNAGRVGDPASVWEENGSFRPLDGTGREPAGTINTILIINRELSRGAMVRSIMTATEAKTAVLQELAVSSRYSDGLATGTGTDQIAVASALNGEQPLTSAGKHAKLGELIGRSVQQAIRKTLSLQNGLTPESQRSVLAHIRRFGATRDSMVDAITARLDDETGGVFQRNFDGFDRDPMAVGAACALVHLRDKTAWGILPESCWKEQLVLYGALLAAAVAHRHEHCSRYAGQLEHEAAGTGNDEFLKFLFACCALGYSEKWKE